MSWSVLYIVLFHQDKIASFFTLEWLCVRVSIAAVKSIRLKRLFRFPTYFPCYGRSPTQMSDTDSVDSSVTLPTLWKALNFKLVAKCTVTAGREVPWLELETMSWLWAAWLQSPTWEQQAASKLWTGPRQGHTPHPPPFAFGSESERCPWEA